MRQAYFPLFPKSLKSLLKIKWGNISGWNSKQTYKNQLQVIHE